jgi:hypothetical protein
VHHYLEYTGSGITVAIREGGRPDSYWNLPGIVPGDCEAAGGTAHCHCPEGNTFGHPRWVAGLVSTSVTPFSGIAPDSTTIFANTGVSGCESHGLDLFTSAVNWATDEGASVINVSAIGADSEQMFWDYKAVTWPWPTVVAGAGNQGHQEEHTVANRLRNGIVVGASTENHLDYAVDSRHDIEMRFNSSWINPEGWGELPHIVAPGTHVVSAGHDPGQIDSVVNTSAATPQVAGAVACLQEQNPALATRPEVIASGLMVSGDINADAGTGGVWPLDLHDGIDDRDGAGQMNMYYTGWTLDSPSRVEPFSSPSGIGHDYGIMLDTDAPPGDPYPFLWNVHVPSGATVRAHFILTSDPNCETSSMGSCSGNPYPESAMLLQHVPTERYEWSTRVDQNWQFVSYTNTSAVAEDWILMVGVMDWNGIESRHVVRNGSWHALDPLADPTPWL